MRGVCRTVPRLAILLAAAAAVVAAQGDTPAPEPAATPAAAHGPSVTLRWSATREDSVYGYLVYRSARREGPYLRLNPVAVHVAPGTVGAVNHYQYVDREVTAGTTYYYYLDTLSTTGRKERFSGVVERTVPADHDAH